MRETKLFGFPQNLPCQYNWKLVVGVKSCMRISSTSLGFKSILSISMKQMTVNMRYQRPPLLSCRAHNLFFFKTLVLFHTAQRRSKCFSKVYRATVRVDTLLDTIETLPIIYIYALQGLACSNEFEGTMIKKKMVNYGKL